MKKLIGIKEEKGLLVDGFLHSTAQGSLKPHAPRGNNNAVNSNDFDFLRVFISYFKRDVTKIFRVKHFAQSLAKSIRKCRSWLEIRIQMFLNYQNNESLYKPF